MTYNYNVSIESRAHAPDAAELAVLLRAAMAGITSFEGVVVSVHEEDATGTSDWNRN